MAKKVALVTGSVGQIGSELVPCLRTIYGNQNVIATGHKTQPTAELLGGGPFEVVDVSKKEALEGLIEKYGVTEIYHLASLLSATSEHNPDLAWHVNVDSLKNVLDIAKKYNLRVFWPSSIGAFGPTTPRKETPQSTILEPSSMYGVTKVSGELLCNYYFSRYNVDVRSIRFPGIISYKTECGGGTTDYSVEIFYDALKKGEYTCYLSENTMLPMCYMDDAIQAIINLMNAPAQNLTVRTSYNLTAFSLTPRIVAEKIQQKMKDFKITYQVDPVRQKIADSWPDSIDDSVARKDWGWAPSFGVDKTAQEMLEKLRQKLSK
eukprot:Phypoly_transcript_13496.p1 GENE.Phypoly_transcript_13496~~Phypoly_transcript_13496.p1  ORF type:complete len:320 (+),score=45.85 Phypoly_transcript_13496:88-1047(+)